MDTYTQKVARKLNRCLFLPTVTFKAKKIINDNAGKQIRHNLNINERDNFVWTKVRDRHLSADVNALQTFIENYLDKDGDLSLDHVLMPQHYYFSESNNILVNHIGILDRVDLTINILNKFSDNSLSLPFKNKNNYFHEIQLSKRHKEIINRIYAKDLEIYSKLKYDYECKS